MFRLLLFRDTFLAAEIEFRETEMLDSVGDGSLGWTSFDNELWRTLWGSD